MSNVYSRLKAIQSLKSSTTGSQRPDKKNLAGKQNSDYSKKFLTLDQSQHHWDEPIEGIWHRKLSIPLAVSLTDIQYFLTCNGISEPLESVYWFDTETTGLSGGAGTVVFLFGWARWYMGQWQLHQVLLQDYSYEPEYWQFVLDHISDARVLVSYNGLTYDQPLVSTRCILNGLRFESMEHIDLLYSARRIWKSVLPSCSLGSIENHVLGAYRIKDIPGSLIPTTYFEYLRQASPCPTTFTGMDLVVSHHEMDHYSMILLSSTLGAIYGLLSSIHRTPVQESKDYASTILEDHAIPFVSIAGLLKTARHLNWLTDDLIDFLLDLPWFKHKPFHSSDTLELARSFYLTKNMEKALPYFISLIKNQSSLWALYRILVWYEWNTKDYVSALTYLNEYQELWIHLPEKSKKPWQNRYNRILQKVSKIQES
jgi:uncharacterized protein YprB with RNaseH-like and TPR domain